ncbi:MAG TPA: response regulator [Rhizomicrobium sp.]|jgi:FixJ family two-component response regulator
MRAAQAISIVDDDDPVRDSMRLLLETFGYSVREYATPAALLDDPQARECSCLILDLHMPGMSGLELVEQLRSEGFEAPALLVTGRRDATLEQRLSRAAILTTLQKPVSEGVLIEWVTRACAATGPAPGYAQVPT